MEAQSKQILPIERIHSFLKYRKGKWNLTGEETVLSLAMRCVALPPHYCCVRSLPPSQADCIYPREDTDGVRLSVEDDKAREARPPAIEKSEWKAKKYQFAAGAYSDTCRSGSPSRVTELESSKNLSYPNLSIHPISTVNEFEKAELLVLDRR